MKIPETLEDYQEECYENLRSGPVSDRCRCCKYISFCIKYEETFETTIDNLSDLRFLISKRKEERK